MKNRLLSKIIFSVYDSVLLNLALPIIWGCKAGDILNLYNKNISSNHLDVGAGTGYFIKNCQSFQKGSKLTIIDIDPVCLDICKRKLKQFSPQIKKHDILKSINTSQKYDSIALNFVFHCLPGKMYEKELSFKNIKNVLKKDGKLFGATFIVKGKKLKILTKIWSWFFNKIGILNNQSDDILELKKMLDHNFKENKIKMIGNCAIFEAKA